MLNGNGVYVLLVDLIDFFIRYDLLCFCYVVFCFWFFWFFCINYDYLWGLIEYFMWIFFRSFLFMMLKENCINFLCFGDWIFNFFNCIFIVWDIWYCMYYNWEFIFLYVCGVWVSCNYINGFLVCYSFFLFLSYVIIEIFFVNLLLLDVCK